MGTDNMRRYVPKLWLLLLTAVMWLSSTGCAALRGGNEPLNVVTFAKTPHHDTLIIFLPGIFDAANDFSRFGFVEAVRAQKMPVDMVAVDAHLGHYLANSLIERLNHDVIAPARARGIQRIWLVGVSLGGMGSMLYADARPLDIDGIIAISPYMGSRDTLDAVEAAGGLNHWEPGPSPPGDFRNGVWTWLKDYPEQYGAPLFYLAYGEDDRYARAHRAVAASLPRAHVTHRPGGHDWETWRTLWDAKLVALRPILAHGGELDTATAVPLVLGCGGRETDLPPPPRSRDPRAGAETC